VIGYDAAPFAIFAFILLISTVLTSFMSNTALVVILLPAALEIAVRLNIDPHLLVITTIIGCSLDFITPLGTPPVTMTLSAGYRFNDYVIVGGLFNIIAFLVALFTLPLLKTRQGSRLSAFQKSPAFLDSLSKWILRGNNG
jgi:di/tricarboxylate transporter